MSRLTDKYQSYPHYKGISFDESTYTLTPTRTGSKLLNGDPVVMSDSLFVSDGLDTPTIATGVLPDQKHYKFTFDNTTSPNKSARIIFGNSTAGSTGGLDDVRRLMWESGTNRVTGIWVKTPASPNSLPAGSGVPVLRFLYGTSAMINISVALSTNNLPAIGIIHSNTEFPTGAIINYYENYTDTNSNVVPIEWNKWYFVAVRKLINETGGVPVNSTATGTIEYQHFINGNSVNLITRTTWTKRSINGISFGSPTTIFKYDFGISSWFIADWSDIGQTQLQEIYNYGAPIQAPVKYYNGTAWVDDISAPKVYYNGAWQDVYANRWTGSAWVPL